MNFNLKWIHQNNAFEEVNKVKTETNEKHEKQKIKDIPGKIISVNLSLKMLRIGKHLNKSVSQILKKMQNQTIKWNGTNKKSVLSNRFYFAKFV